jgi:hypothetical protein
MPKRGDTLSIARPASRQLYKDLLAAPTPVGAFREEVKRPSVHPVRNSAFAGVPPRKEHLVLTLKAEKPIRSSRIFRSEEVSKNR